MVRDRLISPSDLRAEAQQLLEKGKMPSLDQLLAAVASVRQKYGPKLKAARKVGTDDEIQARGESLAEGKNGRPNHFCPEHYGAPENRDDYLDLAYAGETPVDSDGDLPAELEAELPAKFQRAALDENVISDEKQ